jgi:hypothetical protein
MEADWVVEPDEERLKGGLFEDLALVFNYPITKLPDYPIRRNGDAVFTTSRPKFS